MAFLLYLLIWWHWRIISEITFLYVWSSVVGVTFISSRSIMRNHADSFLNITVLGH